MSQYVFSAELPSALLRSESSATRVCEIFVYVRSEDWASNFPCQLNSRYRNLVR
jgi:hypothetical protein